MTSKANARYRDDHWWIMEIAERMLLWGCRRCDKVIEYVPGHLPVRDYNVGACPKRTAGVQGGGADRWPKK